MPSPAKSRNVSINLQHCKILNYCGCLLGNPTVGLTHLYCTCPGLACVPALGRQNVDCSERTQGETGLAQADDDQVPAAQGRDAEQRAAPRFTLLIRAAKLIVDGESEFLCVIRDASSSGLKIRLFNALPEHRELAIEMSNGDCYPVEQIWSEGEYAGFRFTGDVDIERLLDESHGAFPKRQVRLRIHLDAILHSGGEAVRVSFQDISQQGACIESDKWLLMNELVRLETGVMQPIYAKVRWRSHPRYGVLFEQTFKLDELAHLTASLQPSEDTEASRGPRDGFGGGSFGAERFGRP